MAKGDARIARTLCANCGEKVYHLAKSHKHYTHYANRGACPFTKVVDIRMQVLEYQS